MTIISFCLYRALCKLVGEKPDTWDLYLDAVMFGLRTKPHFTTRFSPFFMMFGMEARYPCEVAEDFTVWHVVSLVSGNFSIPIPFLIFVYFSIGKVDSSVEDVVANKAVSSGIALKETFDAMVRNSVVKKQEKRQKIPFKSAFTVGQRVLRKNIRTQQRKGGKLERTWLGPYLITKIDRKSADLMDDNGNQHAKINTDHLKPFIDPAPRIPHRIQKTSPEEPPMKKTFIVSPTIPSVTHSPLPTPLDLSNKPAYHSPPAPSSLKSPINLTVHTPSAPSPIKSQAACTLDPVIPYDLVRSRK